ncbi:MAG TPA: type II secretion system major pseudopilin GspG [Phycisphaerales bacterium]|nr:type II secretion system major pseudopilin GspG [Phycisphaerales bacterium]
MERQAVSTRFRSLRSTRGLRRAFTLIEVMIVILIVLALGGLVAWNLMGTKEEADVNLAKIQMDQIGEALKQFRFRHNRWPTDAEGIAVLWDKEKMTEENDLKTWKKLLEKPVPKDKWGNEWGYRQVSEHGDESQFDLWSYGPDRQEGTDDDIVSWETETDSGTTADSGSSSSSSSGSGSGGGN